ncbi:hypothetical protein TREMEDRAFT_58857 [Tremella mesenterica DSM 1558]|uniref:uncharacterized protein n=1 Tax=Tremella mesenterica (strain ATCC 24925 / CBS 8224 / DSM 1558 / NBRC 9311 / NRRL Y-6157 / RJB 2259-6 / UBC 559-6) TaxID=578456 RepID=UPI0003F49134|nr:uncharacterized protein TREMEDRAFT_58857 [Tremella mesenterica DSM 1558]EIW72688.1 hypothetical protein TREMEDRAFT_58857 [Tremella mesenterica DSM 1558]
MTSIRTSTSPRTSDITLVNPLADVIDADSISSGGTGGGTICQVSTRIVKSLRELSRRSENLIAGSVPPGLDKEDIVNHTIMAVRICCDERRESMDNFTTLVGQAVSGDDPISHGDPEVVTTERVKVLGDRNRIGRIWGYWVQAWPNEETPEVLSQDVDT